MEIDSNWLAFSWLAVLVVTTIGFLVKQVLDSSYSMWENCLYLPTYLLGRLLWRVHFTNSAPPEMQEGALLVSNHRSSVDPCFIQLAARRRVHWLVAKEYFSHFIFGPVLRAVQTIPTNRTGTDTASTKAALRITSQGRLVGMFPEGALNKTPQPLIPIRSGAALVAIRSNVAMIPLLLDGSSYRREVWSPFIMPARVGVTFGTAIYPDKNCDMSDREQADDLIYQWAKQIAALAGQPEFEIPFASKRTANRVKQHLKLKGETDERLRDVDQSNSCSAG